MQPMVTALYPSTFLQVVLKRSHLVNTEVSENAIGVTAQCFFDRFLSLINAQIAALWNISNTLQPTAWHQVL